MTGLPKNLGHCKTNVELGEKVLFASTDILHKEASDKQEAHYLTCNHPQCLENKKFLIENGIFQMDENQQKEYNAKMEELEKSEDLEN